MLARIDAERRAAIRLNHSATHLLHAALRKVLGTHVTQKGSLVAPDRLRFDFSHSQPLTSAQRLQVEKLVNDEIRGNAEAATRMMDYERAIAAGAMALFGEKYESRVRVLSMGEFSTELCGGTHVKRTGDIGMFHIVSETGVAAGVRRIEALTGQAALDYVNRVDTLLADIAQLVHGSAEDTATKVREALERIRALEKENRGLKDKLALGQGTGSGRRRGRRRWRDGARHAGGWRRRRRAAHGGRPIKEPTGIGDRRARLGRVGFESGAGRGSHARSDRARESGGLDRSGGGAGRWQGRRTAGLRAGRRQQAAGARRGAGERYAVGACAAGRTLMNFNVLF